MRDQCARSSRPTGTCPVTGYELAKLRAFNLVIENALGGGTTISLNQDAHSKRLSTVMLEIKLG
jgi:hypothetical protein